MSNNKVKSVSVVVPVLNEEGSISELIYRLKKSLDSIHYKYEIIFIDDRSTDNTAKVIQEFADDKTVKYYIKLGDPGKAQALLEGFSYAQYDLVTMIDSDLQYPPEAIPDMIKKIEAGSDVVIAERREVESDAVRKTLSKAFNYVFARFLHGIKFDVQSGLKVFRKEIIQRIHIKPFPWTFDLEFLLAAKDAGYKISGHNIRFEKRQKGSSKVDIIKTSFQIGLSAILLKVKESQVIPFHKEKQNQLGPGFHYKGIEFVHFSDLQMTDSAVKTFLGHQVLFILGFFVFFGIGLLINWKITLIIFVAVITTLYFLDLLFNFFLIYRSFTRSPEIKVSDTELKSIDEWPRYTIFCPLYKEWEVIPQFVKAIEKMDYPKDKLQVQLLLEQDDKESLEHVKQFDLPSFIQVVVVPHSLPKTKPKACNYGLRQATGEYAVIYDAEDIPDPQQLKKAVVAFNKLPPYIACIQAKLNYYNRSQNLLTRLFTAEYSLWFDLVLTGLQSLKAPIPLGGTSNHFKVEKLKEVKGWDSFNVTEDCDLGIRLAKRGYQTAIMDSLTMEEANSDFFNWINQRSRWIKGYMQTYLVHMRDPKQLLRKDFRSHFATFQIVVGGKILSLFINPLMWLTTILYFSLRATIGPTIEEFFPGPIFYMGVFSLIFGNFLYMYYYMIGCARRKQYDLIKFVFLIPLYWIAMSIAAWKGLFQLIFKPHYWQKTKHGLHIKKTDSAFQVPKEDIGSNQLSFFLQQLIKKGKGMNSAIILLAAGVIANGLNYLYSAYLSRQLSYEEFGLISLVSSFLFITVIPLDSLYSTVTFKTAHFLGKYKEPFKDYWMYIRRRGFIFSILFLVVWAALIPVLTSVFKSDTILPFILFTPVWVFNTLLSVDLGYLSGSHAFVALAFVTVAVPVIKFASAVGFVMSPASAYVYAAIPLSIIGGSFISYLFARNLLKEDQTEFDTKELSFPRPFFFSTVLLKFATVAFISIDLFLAKAFLSPEDAGKYALIAIIGKMIFFVGGLFNQLIIPFLSREAGAKKEKSTSFKIIFSASLISSTFMYLVTGVFGYLTGPILLGEKVLAVTHLLPIYGLGMLGFAIASSIIAYHQVRRNYVFAVIAFTLSFIQIVLTSIFHASIEQFVYVITGVGIANVLIILVLHWFEHVAVAASLNIADFFNLFSSIPTHQRKNKEHCNILIFNWRDTKHVWSGGAEVYVHEIAKRLVKRGHNVTVFCGNDNHSKRYEVIDGVYIIRRGGFFTVYIWAFLYYVLKLRGKFDVIIDSQNGIPFFTPWFAKEPVIGLLHHVHQEVFRNNLPQPFAWIACQLEAKLMPDAFKKVPMITVSESSKKEMEKIGLGKEAPIHLVPPGIDLEQYKPGKKTTKPTVLYLGRLKPYKSIDVLIKAIKKIDTSVPDMKVIIAGFGESRGELVKLADRLGILDRVTFTGQITEDEKLKLLREAWVFVQPSSMEGWGISAVEAQASGTYVIASDVPGLRDSVHEGTGEVITYKDVEEFAKRIKAILLKRPIIRKSQYEWIYEYSWEKSASKLEALIKQVTQCL